MAELPSGTVTFLFTDLEGSTRLWEEEPAAMRHALERHDSILREEIDSRRGHIVKTTGDGVHAAFETAADAVAAAVAMQLALGRESWPVTGPLMVRMGIHTGEADLRDGDYYGTALNRAARLMSIAHGGQIVVSLATSELVRDTGVQLIDLGDHRLRDLGHPEHVYQVSHPELPPSFPALQSIGNLPSNLPLQTTSFVGREDDMAQVSEALLNTRLVTLTGVGGVGKTRLAVQVAAEVLPRYRDGAWLCELGPLRDEEGLADLVAGALAIGPRPGLSTMDTIVERLRTKQLLLVLDNCEHLISAASTFTDALLGACPDIRVLATSREGLGVRGEHQITVRSLDPVVESPQLFLDRAHHTGARIDLDPLTVEAVTQICRRLDGIPLALELAAARTRMMTPPEIAARLDERFRLLTGGSRTAVERHQTLRQAVDWSYDLLSSREQKMLNRLGVFVGGFTLDAAESVIKDDEFANYEVFDGVASLVDKSLVIADRSSGETRYRLLETIRQYALERLDADGTADETRRRHAAWFVEFVEYTRGAMIGPHELEWHSRVDRETENIRAAVTWAVEHDETDIALRLVGGVPFFSLMFREQGYPLAALAALALQTPRATEHPSHPYVLAVRSLDHQNHGRLEAAERDARTAIRQMNEPGHEWSIDPWGALWSTLIFAGRAEELLPSLGEIAERAAATVDDVTLFVAQNLAAGALFAADRAADGVELAESNLILADQLGSNTFRALSRFTLGGALADQDPARAGQLFRESAELGRAAGMEHMTAMALARLGRMTGVSVDQAWARDFRAALDLSVDSGDPRTLASLFQLYGQVLGAQGRYESATLLLSHCSATAPDVANPVVRAALERWQTRLNAELGDGRFAKLWNDGSAMTSDSAVALMRSELDRVADHPE
jgi:predicted ATPase/class 3 adenylate cyclase